MDTAAAIAQIQAVMSAPTEPVACVILRADGSVEEQVTDQRKISVVLGGVPTVVGAIMSLGVQAVAKQGATIATNHTFPSETFEPNIKGDVVLFRTGSDAEPIAFTAAQYNEWVDKGRPDEPVASEEEESGEEMEEGEEESGEEESDESESESEEGETFADFSDRMKELPLEELKKACRLCNLSDQGTQEQLLARMYDHAQRNASGDDSSDGSDSDNIHDDSSDSDSGPDPVEQTRTYLLTLDEDGVSKTARKLGVDESGGKEAVIARICEALVAGSLFPGGDDSDSEDGEDEDEESGEESEESEEEDDDEEENDEAKAVEMEGEARAEEEEGGVEEGAGATSQTKAKSPPVSAASDKTRTSPGPVKTIAKNTGKLLSKMR
jgi:hypothetical protein